MAKFCRFCGNPIKENAKFCENCGKSLAKASAAPVPPVCPRCGEPLAPDVVFCGNCGLNLQQGAEYTFAAPESTVSENWQQDWNPAQNQQQGWTPQQQQGREYHQQQRWAQPQPQPGPNVRETVRAKRQGRSVSSLLQGFGSSKMLMAAAAAVILLVIGITGFWKPGFLLDLFRSTAKLENGMLALNDITLDFKQTNLKNGAATLATVKDKEEEIHNGLFGDLYVMKVDKSCQGKVTVSIPVPKNFKPTTGNGLYIKFGVGRDYVRANGKTARYYSYFDTTIKDGKVVATIDPAALGQSVHKWKASVQQEDTSWRLGDYAEYMGFFFKNGRLYYGEAYQYSKGHFRLWYSYNLKRDAKNTFMNSDDAENLLTDLEEAYDYFRTHGYKDHVDNYTPIDVYIERTDDEGGWDPIRRNMELREDRIFGGNYDERYEGELRTKTRTTIYHEFFHAVQESFIGIYDFYKDTRKNNWFDEATGTHFEKLVNKDISENGKEHFWNLWQGPIPKGSTKEEGYARGLLIDYMSNNLGGDHWIKDCYSLWSPDYSKFRFYMQQIARKEADFSAKFYLEVIKSLGISHMSPKGYYNHCQDPSKVMKEDTYLSAIRLELDSKAKEKIAKGEKDALPVVFTSPPFEIEGYGGRVVALVTRVRNSSVNLGKDLPDKCQLKLEAEGCKIQLIAFKPDSDKITTSPGNVIPNIKENTVNNNFLYLVLVTSTKPTKQNVVLKATLGKEEKLSFKKGVYRGKTTMRYNGKKQEVDKSRMGFVIYQQKDGRWYLNRCKTTGNYYSDATSVPLVYDQVERKWLGHRKFKEDLYPKSTNKNKKIIVGNIDCTVEIKQGGRRPILIIDYENVNTKNFGDVREEKTEIHCEGQYMDDMLSPLGTETKLTILE